jgi:recombinational DNA repair ATPase RecF
MLAEAASRSVTRVGRLWVDDFRCLRDIDLELNPGLTVIHGPNGQGKTSLLEAIAWIASAHSFRGVADAPLVRTGCEQAIVRAEIFDDDRLQRQAEVRKWAQPNPLQRAIPARAQHGLLRVRCSLRRPRTRESGSRRAVCTS